MKSINKQETKGGFEVVKGLITLIGLILTLHYFLSYKWLYNFFKYYNLEMMSLISWDDIRFTFGDMNSTIMIPAFFGFIWIAVIRLFASNKLYFNFNREVKKEVKKGIDAVNEELKKPNSFTLILISVLSTLIFGFFIYLSLPAKSDFSNTTLILLFLLLIFLPFFYLYLSEKRNVVLGFYIFFIFCWSNYALNSSFKKAVANPSTNYSEIEFDYKGQLIKSDSVNCHIYSGYKVTILYDTISKSSNIFKASEIGRIKYTPARKN